MVEWWWLPAGVFAAFLVAWVNGANNAANAIGTAVGSKALSVKKALWFAAIFDFMGAMLYGQFVSKTLMKGIVDTSMIADVKLIVVGMLSALLATGIWVIMATWFRIPMSISQAIVGGVVGFGIYVVGYQNVNWGLVTAIITAWLVLPVMSGLIAVALYRYVHPRLQGLDRKGMILVSSIMYFLLVFTTIFLLNVKTLKVSDLAWALGSSIAASLILTLPYHIIVSRKTPRDPGEARSYLFRILLLVTAAAMAFSHGANDVANSAGPLAGIMIAVEKGMIPEKVTIPLPALALSAFGIASGIVLWGYRVIETIGEKITLLNIETAFIAQFSGSIAILIVTRLGLPVSTTVAIVGAVAGVGFAKGVESVNIKTLAKIVAAWFIAFPVVAGLAMLFIRIFTMI